MDVKDVPELLLIHISIIHYHQSPIDFKEEVISSICLNRTQI